MKALIFKIDRLNTHNGEGFRTVIYFKGCQLHCSWCHNPEGINPKPEVWYQAAKCIGCGTCISECQEGALSMTEDGIKIDRTKCIGCQHCTDVCPTKAMEPIGKLYSTHDLFKIILQDKMLFKSSGGGITVTGGEPGLYPDFVAELFSLCRAEGIHTAFDTSGVIPTKNLEALIKYTDIVFFDIKTLDEKVLKSYTGLSLKQFYTSIQWLQSQLKRQPNLKVEFRTPLVPGVTDSMEGLNNIADFISENFDGVKWELCMFNDLCQDKYLKMSREWRYTDKKHTKNDYNLFATLQKRLPNNQLLISGFVDESHKG